jgi:hypothetical protein
MLKDYQTDPRTRHIVQPKQIVWKSGIPEGITNSEILLQPGSGQATMWSRPGCMLKNEGKAPGFLLDFGLEINGGIQIICGSTPDQRPVRIRLRFGESVSEAMGQPNNDHSLHDGDFLVSWGGATEIGNTGFRFVRIDLIDEGAHLEIKEVRAIALHRDLEYKGTFECSDDRLNRIWQTAVWTVQLNMQEYVWDGIKRDRLVWLGDLHPESMVISSVFGDVDVVPRSLDLARDETPLPNFINGISSYSLWWIIIQHHWYWYHGNLEYLRQQKEYLSGLTRLLEKYIGQDGRESLPQMRFLDWPTAGNEQVVHAGLQSLMTMAFQCAREMFSFLGESEEASRCREAVNLLQKHSPSAGDSKQGNALKVLAGLAGAQETNQQALAKNPLQGISTFYGYYVLQARAMAGDYKGTMDLIKSYWGGMLDLGATTFWLDKAGRIDQLPAEDKVDVHATYGDHCYKGLRHSFCHGWAGGPAAWLIEHVLGFQPLEPGCGKVAVRPNLGELTWAKGSFPTPQGIIRVSHQQRPDGEIESEMEAPKGVEIVRE